MHHWEAAMHHWEAAMHPWEAVMNPWEAAMHPLKALLDGSGFGIASYCTANEIVLEAAMEDAAEHGALALVEATANQVNQFGGYTGMKPKDFAGFAQGIAKKAGLKPGLLVLGGDHLGPLAWQAEPEEAAMRKAEELVCGFVEAGFSKIHLDTSMRLADDPNGKPLPTETIAKRGARLAKAAMSAWGNTHGGADDAMGGPVFVIGSEVPVPGGAKGGEEAMAVTSPVDFAKTVDVYHGVFLDEGLSQAWGNVIGIVVQPGVEFFDSAVRRYDPSAASKLAERRKDYPSLVFEGHSTDYQTEASLVGMALDGVRILKVGPELTFSLREALLALALVEDELIPEQGRSNFRAALDGAMLQNPGYWAEYYRGDAQGQKLARIYSYYDRCRYYLGDVAVQEAMCTLFANIDSAWVPPSVLHQYMPAVCEKLAGHRSAKASARELAKLHLRLGVLNKYRKALAPRP